MTTFRQKLRSAQPDSRADRDWIYVGYDQLCDQFDHIVERDAGDIGIVLVESRAFLRRRPYHRQKLGLLLANMRHFAIEQAERGVAVRYEQTDQTIAARLAEVAEQQGPLTTMVAAEYEIETALDPLADDGLLDVRPNQAWMSRADQFEESQDGTPWRQDAFYRHMRQQTGILMEDDSPVGGKYSFDPENRKFWKGEPEAPTPPRFSPDDITREVGELIEAEFDDHPGRLDLEALPATQADADRLWDWALSECMEHFGPFEDAMSQRSRTLFHTRISPLLNISRLLPRRVLADVVELDIPINSKEGFVRQVLGWREFIKHVHRETAGFRRLPSDFPMDSPPQGRKAHDGGYGRWTGQDWEQVEGDDIGGGARPNYFGAERPIPPAYWGDESGLNCLDTVVEGVLEEAWSHHITRLMVLSNIAAMLEVDPRELTDWFWAAYADAYDWVVEPNVLGMGTFALGDLFMTKPYVASSNYINKMSDFCGECAFSPTSNCPLRQTYWAFLARHEDKLSDNQRMNMMMASLRKRSDDKKDYDRRVFEWVRETLTNGERVEPDGLPEE